MMPSGHNDRSPGGCVHGKAQAGEQGLDAASRQMPVGLDLMQFRGMHGWMGLCAWQGVHGWAGT